MPWKPPGRVFAPSSSVIPMQDRDLQPQCGVQVASFHAYRMCIAESNRRAKLVTFAETFPWILRSYVLHIFPPYISKIKLCFFLGGFRRAKHHACFIALICGRLARQRNIQLFAMSCLKETPWFWPAALGVTQKYWREEDGVLLLMLRSSR